MHTNEKWALIFKMTHENFIRCKILNILTNGVRKNMLGLWGHEIPERIFPTFDDEFHTYLMQRFQKKCKKL